MLNGLIRFSLRHRLLVIAGCALIAGLGALALRTLQVDVFPDVNRPSVTIFAEAPGLAPEEVEVLVAAPIEAAVNGAPDVERVRSVSSAGLALVFVDFRWNSDPYRNRQIVTERLQEASSGLPRDVVPTLGPISSIMGEVMLVGLRADPRRLSALELRTLADWTLRPRLLAVTGVSQVTTIGGDVKQYQVLVDPYELVRRNVTLAEVEQAAAAANANTAGGYLELGPRESVVRNIGRVTSVDELGLSVVATRDGVPVLLRDLGRVTVGPAPSKRGDAAMNAAPAVILSVQKQPGADTVELTARLERELEGLRQAMPPGVEIDASLFRQADFIAAAITNVEHALRDGSLIVAGILLLFLLNMRATVITLTAIPFSFLTAAGVLSLFGASVNTMTLGGLAIAVGELVDDAIVDVENVVRRLRENRESPHPRPILDVVYAASSEVRGSIVYATVVVLLAFLPLFFLQGLEGRLLAPLGLAYVVSLSASLFVSLTLTPVLCSYLLPKARAMARHGDSFVVRHLKAWDRRLLEVSLNHPVHVIALAAVAFVVALGAFTLLGREFLPPFNESSITVNVVAAPGTSLAESNRLGHEAEEAILGIEHVRSTGRRTGRAELDEHAEGVHYSEIDVVLHEEAGSNREAMEIIRGRLASIPGVELNIGQPISHRLDHLLSGVEAQVAIKIFGDDLPTLMARAQEVRDRVARIPGVVDLSVEKQAAIPQVQIVLNRKAAAEFGVPVGEASDALATALNGRVVSTVLEGHASFDLVVRLDQAHRQDRAALERITLDGPDGRKIPLTALATIVETTGPNQVLREGGQRRMVVQCNVAGRDLGSVVDEIRQAVNESVRLSPGYFVTYGGQFESQQQATRLILLLSVLALGAIFVVLYAHFGSAMIALQIMMNVPMAIIGGVVAVVLTGGTLSVASLVGFVTLAGIASRNGIMMISHYLHLMEHEGETFGRAMIIRGSLERLTPVLMTALGTALALLPLALSAGEAGKEILQPVAVVILGGLISSTLLDQAVTPALFYQYGRRIFGPATQDSPGWSFTPGVLGTPEDEARS